LIATLRNLKSSRSMRKIVPSRPMDLVIRNPVQRKKYNTEHVRRSTLERPKQSLRFALSVRCEKSFRFSRGTYDIWEKRRPGIPLGNGTKVASRPHFATFRDFFRCTRDCSSAEQMRAPASGIELPPRWCRGARKVEFRTPDESDGQFAGGPRFRPVFLYDRVPRPSSSSAHCMLRRPRMRTEVQITGRGDRDLSHDVSMRRGAQSVAEQENRGVK